MKTKTTQKAITDKKKMEQLSIAKVLEAQFGVDLKCLLDQTQTYLNYAGSSGLEEGCSRSWLTAEPEESLVLSCPS